VSDTTASSTDVEPTVERDDVGLHGELDDAIAEADRSESVSSAVVLAELERIASSSKR
jgi:hypothetical protein